MMSIGRHPRLIGQAKRSSALREFIEHAPGRGQGWICNRIEVAGWWQDHHRVGNVTPADAVPQASLLSQMIKRVSISRTSLRRMASE